jgi:glycosyltransferase involved in cell wall biosynthesis
MRVAVVHDWLYVFGGAERVLRSILRCLPQADLFTLFDVNSEADKSKIGYSKASTSFLQKMPFISRMHRNYLPMMPLAIEQFDLGSYDLVISSSYAVAKGVITGPDQLHLAYVHSPMRYAWDLQHQYLSDSGNATGLRGIFARTLLHRMRSWDRRTATGVDAFMANSHFIARRVRKTYGRQAQVIYPPVRMPDMCPTTKKGNYFLTASRLVGYKNTHLIVEAFNDMPHERLVVAGSGPDLDRLRSIARPNIEVLGFVPEEELRDLMAGARAFVFAGEEDFGIVLVEAQSEGTPVLALGRGGALETVVEGGPGATGIFFDTATPDAIKATVADFIQNESAFDRKACHANARRFSEERFATEFQDFVFDHYNQFQAEIHRSRLRPISAVYETVETPVVLTTGFP